MKARPRTTTSRSRLAKKPAASASLTSCSEARNGRQHEVIRLGPRAARGARPARTSRWPASSPLISPPSTSPSSAPSRRRRSTRSSAAMAGATPVRVGAVRDTVQPGPPRAVRWLRIGADLRLVAQLQSRRHLVVALQSRPPRAWPYVGRVSFSSAASVGVAVGAAAVGRPFPLSFTPAGGSRLSHTSRSAITYVTSVTPTRLRLLVRRRRLRPLVRRGLLAVCLSVRACRKKNNNKRRSRRRRRRRRKSSASLLPSPPQLLPAAPPVCSPASSSAAAAAAAVAVSRQKIFAPKMFRAKKLCRENRKKTHARKDAKQQEEEEDADGGRRRRAAEEDTQKEVDYPDAEAVHKRGRS